MLIHLPADLGRLGQEGAGFFESCAVDTLGAGGIDLLGGGQELGLVGVHAFGSGDLLPDLPAHRQRSGVEEEQR